MFGVDDVVVGCYLVYVVRCDGLYVVEVVVVDYVVVEQIGNGGQFDVWVWMYVDVFVGGEIDGAYVIEEDEWFYCLVCC